MFMYIDIFLYNLKTCSLLIPLPIYVLNTMLFITSESLPKLSRVTCILHRLQLVMRSNLASSHEIFFLVYNPLVVARRETPKE